MICMFDEFAKFSFKYSPIVKAYIDPGTGSMLFTILISLISIVVYGIRGLIIKSRYSFGSKRENKINDTIPFAIYSDDKRYWTIFKPICDEFEKRSINLIYYSQSVEDEEHNQEYNNIKFEFIGDGNKAFTKLNFINADILLSTTPGLNVYQWKRSKDVKCYIHLPHMISDITTYRMFGIDYYDSIILSGQYQVDQIRKLEELRNLPEKEIKLLGCPYFDAMYNRHKNINSIKNETPKVLVAPTWGPNGILNKYGEKIINELLDTGYDIVIRPHPQSYKSEKEMLEKLMKKYPQIEWNNDTDNFDILNRSDIMISDYSGVIFDYSLIFDKPIIYTDTKFDDSIYDAWWLDEELWTFKVLPNLGEKLDENNIYNIKNIIDNCISNNIYKIGRENAKKETWINQGCSTNKIVDYLINKQKELSNIGVKDAGI